MGLANAELLLECRIVAMIHPKHGMAVVPNKRAAVMPIMEA
jgi:hypothetical protein